MYSLETYLKQFESWEIIVFQIGFQWTENLMQSLSFSYQAFLPLGLLLLTNVASQEKIMLVKELNFL